MSADGTVHETPVRVRYGEVDRMAVVYHANYLVYFEQGRTEFMRSLGATYRALEDDGTLLVVIETGVRHRRPAMYDDLLTVRTRLSELKGVRMRFDYELRRDEELLATGFTTLASTDRQGRPRRMPRSLQEAIRHVTGAHGGKSEAASAVQEGQE